MPPLRQHPAGLQGVRCSSHGFRQSLPADLLGHRVQFPLLRELPTGKFHRFLNSGKHGDGGSGGDLLLLHRADFALHPPRLPDPARCYCMYKFVYEDKMPIDVTGFSDYFIIFCLFFCTLQVLNSWMFWNMAIPRLVGLAVGSLLFSASIVINVQVLMARGSNQVKEPGLIVLKLATSSSYLLLSELASLTT